ncbi:MAG: hypothetical protein HY471_00615 [Candidatus Sungbacteria bacterium]|nr:hypothetical protein [Candidatus Sungbacteria bacterium]
MLERLFTKVFQRLYVPPTERELLMDRAMRLAAHPRFGPISGDYLEFGVRRGKSLIWAYHKAQKYRMNDMRFFAFDSFQGLPPIAGIDCEAEQFKEGEYACTEEEMRINLRRNGVDLGKVVTVPGWYHETLIEATKRKLNLKSAAVVMVDCDLYSSAVPVLNFISDLVVDGTLIMFDDWFCFRARPQKGEQRAFREWLINTPSITATEYYRYWPFGNTFILHRDRSA